MSAENISPDELIEQFEEDHSDEDAPEQQLADNWCSITA